MNLAALPDLIFTVLFFFMIVTHMRDVSPQVQYEMPQGTEIEKNARKTGMVYLFIGKPMDAADNETLIQLNDRLVSIDQIADAVNEERQQMAEDARRHMTVSIRADRDTEMGIINDVKQQLRKAGALHVVYSATSRNPQKHN